MRSMMFCMHCLKYGDWVDEDKCPKCTNMGHTSPWTVGGCFQCNNEYFHKMELIQKKVELRIDHCDILVKMREEIDQLKKKVDLLEDEMGK